MSQYGTRQTVDRAPAAARPAESRPARASPLAGRRATLLAAGACLLSFVAFLVAQRVAGVTWLDLDVYRAEGWAIRTGADLYELRVTKHELPATYPPFAALLFVPLTWVGVETMRVAATVLNLALLLTLVWLTLRLIGRRPWGLSMPGTACAVAAVAVWCEPVWTTLRYGQINLLIAVLVLWDLSRRCDHRWAGVGIGIAAGIKLTPALFAVLLAVAGGLLAVRRLRRGAPAWNWLLRRAAMAVGAFCATVAVGALAAPRDSWRFWSEVIFDKDRAGSVEGTANQSLRGVAARALHTVDPGAGWLLPALLVGCVGLATAVAALLAADRLPHARAWAAVACGVTALLVCPISWSHHWVWAVPMVLLLAAEAARTRQPRWLAATAAIGLLFFTYALWWVPHFDAGRPELRQSVGQMLLSGVYPALGLAFLALAATVVTRAWLRRPPGPLISRPLRPRPVPARTR
ncbi:glycosyltransferase 87 family protein [Streptomyces hainanensis]|uniref:glycosyltransferase 87 family protein n=1 Tax=Streptomyces hainanensis TaxID=402648 RepID=UPI001FB600F6|nr:glycosyltransferase 87 family protein [Streptomyces hainanensis]